MRQKIPDRSDYQIAVWQLRLLEKKFWAAIDKNGPLIREEIGACWVWNRSITNAGYGTITLGSNRRGDAVSFLAHRLSWELNIGKIPGDLHVCHKCDNPRCVNPSHLFLGTHVENMMDMVRKGRAKMKPGSKHPNSKLTEADVIAIRASVEHSDILAERYGVNKRCIQKVRSFRSWTHIGGRIG